MEVDVSCDMSCVCACVCVLPSSIGFASRTCCSIQECWPLMAARNWRISLVLSVFPAPDSPLSNQNNSKKMWSCLRKTNDFKRLFIILKFLMILRDLQHLHFYQFLFLFFLLLITNFNNLIKKNFFFNFCRYLTDWQAFWSAWLKLTSLLYDCWFVFEPPAVWTFPNLMIQHWSRLFLCMLK